MTALAMTLMIIMVGLVVDVGHAMLVQRQLQAGVDAAALAGAQHLPDAPMAESVAMQYGPTPQNKNAVSTVGNATTTAKVSCLAGVPGCNRRDGGVNGIVVSAQSKVPTWFGRIIGITYLTVNATATACAPCSVKPLDIMVVLDRTGSMCESAPGVNDPNCTDLKNARNGVRAFVSNLDPSIDKVGLALFPAGARPVVRLEVSGGRVQAVERDEQPESPARELGREVLRLRRVLAVLRPRHARAAADPVSLRRRLARGCGRNSR